MNGPSAAFMMMGVAAVTMVAATVGFKAAAAPAHVKMDVDITLHRRIDRAGASVAITSDGAAVFRPDGDVILSSTSDETIVFGCQCASERARAVVVSSDGTTLVIGVPDANEVVVMRRKLKGWFEHQVIRRPDLVGFGFRLVLSPDGTRLFITSYDAWMICSLVGDVFSHQYQNVAAMSATNREVTHVVSAKDGRIDVCSNGETVWSYQKVDSERVMSLAIDSIGHVLVAYTAADVVLLAQSGRNGHVVDTLKNTIDGFGRAILIHKNMCFIGSPYEDRVYVYSIPDFKYITSLLPESADSALGSEFGAQLSVSDGWLAVLAPGYGQNERGAVFVFKLAPISHVPIVSATR
jgi:hypothetical protein